MKKEFNNGVLTIYWKKHKCKHSEDCVKSLPQVFNPEEKPWIKMNNAPLFEVIQQVRKCPSGALSLKADEFFQKKYQKVQRV
jgi:uncharacterized Fe-S cluster protein YjdI